MAKLNEFKKDEKTLVEYPVSQEEAYENRPVYALFIRDNEVSGGLHWYNAKQAQKECERLNDFYSGTSNFVEVREIEIL